jgi:hypothetical protein
MEKLPSRALCRRPEGSDTPSVIQQRWYQCDRMVATRLYDGIRRET